MSDSNVGRVPRHEQEVERSLRSLRRAIWLTSLLPTLLLVGIVFLLARATVSTVFFASPF